MVIKPVLPATPPEYGEAPSPRTLPLRQDSGFLDMLKAATQAKVAPVSHRVQSGESLWRICEDTLKTVGSSPSKGDINAAVHRVAAANKLKNADVLSVGQTLDLSQVRGAAPNSAFQFRSDTLTPDRVGTSRQLAAKRTTPNPANLPDSQTSRAPLAALAGKQRGAMGGALPTTRPIFHRLSNARPPIHARPLETPVANDAITPINPVDLTALMQSILDPGPLTPETPAATGPWSKLLAGAGRFTSGFGVRSDPFSGKPQFHPGIDIAADSGTEVYPYMPGTVKSTGWDAGHGNMVVIEHPNGMETVYAHASETLVKAGDVVLKDTPIAKVGSTGRSTGPHLHFEVRRNNKAIDPLPLISQSSLNVAKAL